MLKLKRIIWIAQAMLLLSLFNWKLIMANEPQEPDSGQTVGDVHFLESNKPIEPLNPTDSEDPIVPSKPGTGNPGPLSLDYVSDFHFGVVTASAEDETYSLLLDQGVNTAKEPVDMPNFVQVTDNRGTQAGWYLTIAQDNQFMTADQQELRGAQITLAQASLKTTKDNKTTIPPTSFETPLSLSPDQSEQSVISAKEGTGMASWLAIFGKDESAGAQLFIPGVSKKMINQSYTTSFTWNLRNTPI